MRQLAPAPPALRGDELPMSAYFFEGYAWFWLCMDALVKYSDPKLDWLTE